MYQQARQRNPSRWSQKTRNWTPIEAVALNPERDAVVSMAVQSKADKTPMATPNCSTYGRSNCSRQDGRIMTMWV